MNKLLISLVGVLTLGATLPALAGPATRGARGCRQTRCDWTREVSASSLGAAARPRSARAKHSVSQQTAQGTIRRRDEGMPRGFEMNAQAKQRHVMRQLGAKSIPLIASASGFDNPTARQPL